VSGLLTRPAPPAPPAPPGGNGARPIGIAEPPAPSRAAESGPIRVAAFAALAAFGALHWTRLVVDPPTGRLVAVVAVATAAAAGLLVIGRLRPAALRLAAAAAIALVGLLLGLVVTGLQARLLLPANWSELIDGIDRGLSGIRAAGWPYDGPDPWVRLTILLGAPALVALAATLAFWPARRGQVVLRAAGLVVLLVLYGTAVTEHDPGAPLLRGLVLLMLVGAWLWAPRLAPREAATGAAVVLAAGIVAMPLSVRLDGDRPWWDYRAWDWFGGGGAVTFDWTHRYGPLDWPREGTTMLNVRASRPHYWKAQTLDSFDGVRWVRTERNDGIRRRLELPPRGSPDERWEYGEFNPRWAERIGFTVRSLGSSLVIGAGITFAVQGVDAAISVDGTSRLRDGALEEGDTYSVSAYVPDPTPAQLAGAPSGYPFELRQYTEVALPGTGRGGTSETGLPNGLPNPRAVVQVPLRDEPTYGSPRPGEPAVGTSLGERAFGTPRAERRLLASGYGRMYRLARRLTDGTPTAYDAVRAVERHLKTGYRYFERVPRHDLPLDAFLFEDRQGYCQQFSGAMALMLRMAGIPARVATGFTRGSFNRSTREWRVRDLDAHSWVEVYFSGIGWVNFDPTPATAPAEGQTPGLGGAGPGGSPRIEPQDDAPAPGSEQSAQADNPGSGGGGAIPWLPPLLIGVLGLGAAIALWVRGAWLRRAFPPEGVAELQLAELHRALDKLGWAVPGGVTLLALERRLARAAGPASARYAARLRAHRYEPAAPRPPGRSDRRALRRELGSAGGLRGRLRALLAIPPGGPRSSRSPFREL
jgi:protein-glutamine gamma-glutamyltransferase